jgi:type II secretory pathway pseudopilin PulG
MRFYLEYINHLGRLQKKSAHRRLQAGFTMTEILLAGLMMLVAILVAGIGVINLLRSNYQANADSEIQNNLNRTLEFVSDDVRRARIIADSEGAIVSGQIPVGARAVLAFQIPNPSNPSQPISEQIVYYTKGPESNLTGPRVLWRFGPDLDNNGNYITPENTGSWKHSPVTDMLADATDNQNRRDCDPFRPGNLTGWERIPADPNLVEGFYTCVRQGGGQVILNANAQVNMTTNEAVKYSVSTRVSTRATNEIFFLAPPPSGETSTPPESTPLSPPTSTVEVPPIGTPDTSTPPESIPPTPPTPPFTLTNPSRRIIEETVPIVTVPATVRPEVIQGPNCPFPSCRVVTRLPNARGDSHGQQGAMGSTIQANAGDSIRIFVNGMSNIYGDDSYQSVDVYTSSSNLPQNINIRLTNNQLLFVFTELSTSQSYQVLVNITPRS